MIQRHEVTLDQVMSCDAGRTSTAMDAEHAREAYSKLVNEILSPEARDHRKVLMLLSVIAIRQRLDAQGRRHHTGRMASHLGQKPIQ